MHIESKMVYCQWKQTHTEGKTLGSPRNIHLSAQRESPVLHTEKVGSLQNLVSIFNKTFGSMMDSWHKWDEMLNGADKMSKPGGNAAGCHI
jgi:hypothetical protein